MSGETSTVLTPSISELQEDVVAGIRLVRELALRGVSLVQEEQAEEWKDCASSCDQAIQNVTNLELRAAIVAPMSAGKSTIINAIVGESVLPVRNSAMTCVPTAIRFSGDSEPRIKLPEALQKDADSLSAWIRGQPRRIVNGSAR
tara:strand:+ start:2450 stop:2884 length:435 start_codon:yes stop_codon:yes gene_type:complete